MLVAVACNKQAAVSPAQNQKQTDETASRQTYDNTQYNYEVKYPKEYRLNPQATATTVSIPQSLYPKTNFGQANLSVNLYFNGQESCEKYTFNNSMVFPGKEITKESLNGNTFYALTYNSAAAGTAYKTKLYRNFRNNVCYEINLTFGVGNIGNYTPGTVTAVDENDVWKRLNQLLGTFKFTK